MRVIGRSNNTDQERDQYEILYSRRTLLISQTVSSQVYCREMKAILAFSWANFVIRMQLMPLSPWYMNSQPNSGPVLGNPPHTRHAGPLIWPAKSLGRIDLRHTLVQPNELPARILRYVSVWVYGRPTSCATSSRAYGRCGVAGWPDNCATSSNSLRILTHFMFDTRSRRR
jgi:hypothetical protein